MTVKLSAAKVSRLLKLYCLGLSQVEISGKLDVDQSTVSLYVKEFSLVVEEEGLEAAAKEYGIMDIVKELHSIGAEMNKADLTMEEVGKCLKVAKVLGECGIPQVEYKDVAATCKKMKNEGFLSSAVELHQLESATGKTHQELLIQASSAATQFNNLQVILKRGTAELQEKGAKLAGIKIAVAEAKSQQNATMKKLGVDSRRLEKIESLAISLKKADVADDGIEAYMKQQNLLNQAGIPIGTFAQILTAMKVQTAADGGKNLLKKLTQYDGLDGVTLTLKQQEQALSMSVKDLDTKVKLKGEVEAALKKLQAQKAAMEATVYKLSDRQQALETTVNKLKNNESALLQNLGIINAEIIGKQQLIQNLDRNIMGKEKKVVDLSQLESKRDSIAAELVQLEMRAVEKKRHFEVVEALEGYMQSTSPEAVGKFIKEIPGMMEEFKEKYKPNVIRAYIFEHLTGKTLRVLKCGSCDARFYVDKPASAMGYMCPACGMSFDIHVDKAEIDILQAALANVKPDDKTLKLETIRPPNETIIHLRNATGKSESTKSPP